MASDEPTVRQTEAGLVVPAWTLSEILAKWPNWLAFSTGGHREAVRLVGYRRRRCGCPGPWCRAGVIRSSNGFHLQWR